MKKLITFSFILCFQVQISAMESTASNLQDDEENIFGQQSILIVAGAEELISSSTADGAKAANSGAELVGKYEEYRAREHQQQAKVQLRAQLTKELDEGVKLLEKKYHDTLSQKEQSEADFQELQALLSKLKGTQQQLEKATLPTAATSLEKTVVEKKSEVERKEQQAQLLNQTITEIKAAHEAQEKVAREEAKRLAGFTKALNTLEENIIALGQKHEGAIAAEVIEDIQEQRARQQKAAAQQFPAEQSQQPASSWGCTLL